jgi:hypothetical protein
MITVLYSLLGWLNILGFISALVVFLLSELLDELGWSISRKQMGLIAVLALLMSLILPGQKAQHVLPVVGVFSILGSIQTRGSAAV